MLNLFFKYGIAMSWDRMSNDLDAQIVKNDSVDGLSKEQLLEQCPLRGKRPEMSTRCEGVLGHRYI